MIKQMIGQCKKQKIVKISIAKMIVEMHVKNFYILD